MNSFSRRLIPLLVSTATTFAGVTVTDANANPGDLISHRAAPPVVTHSTMTTYRVAGWERELTSVTPNLGNYYWEPMTKRIVNTTRTTSRGAVAAPPIQVKRGGNYVRPVQAQMPLSNHPLALAAVPGQLHVPQVIKTTSTVLTYSHQPVQSNQSTSMKWNTGRNQQPSQTTNIATRESVYGVLKSPAAPVRSSAQSL